MMKQFLKKIGFILLTSFIIITLLSVTSLWLHRQSTFFKPSFVINGINETQLDYIVIGASTGLTTINTKAIDSIAHTNGVNLSMDDTGLPSQYLMLKHFLAQGKTAKVCVLAPSVSSYDAIYNNVSDNDHRFLPYVHNDYVSEYYDQFSTVQSKILKASKWMPILGVSYYNTELVYASLLTLLKPKTSNRFDDKGNYTYPEVDRVHKDILKKKSLNVSFKNEYVKKIKALCDQNNIKLICYFSPVANRSVVCDNRDYKVVNHTDLLKNTMYFYDNIHVNSKGRQTASISLALILKEVLN